MKTLLLTVNWDLKTDSAGNIASVSGDYALAQDVATACRLFYGELWYNNAVGVPYFEKILGKRPARSVAKNLLRTAALRVPGVVDAKVYIDGIENRKLVGRINFTDETGKSHNVTL